MLFLTTKVQVNGFPLLYIHLLTTSPLSTKTSVLTINQCSMIGGMHKVGPKFINFYFILQKSLIGNWGLWGNRSRELKYHRPGLVQFRQRRGYWQGFRGLVRVDSPGSRSWGEYGDIRHIDGTLSGMVPNLKMLGNPSLFKVKTVLLFNIQVPPLRSREIFG